MTDEECRAILEQARQTIEHQPGEDAPEQWRRQQPRREPTWAERKAESDAAWNAWADRRIAVAIDKYDAELAQEIGEAIAEERKREREEMAKLKATLELRLDGLAHELTKHRAVAEGDVIELPSPLRYRRHDAA